MIDTAEDPAPERRRRRPSWLRRLRIARRRGRLMPAVEIAVLLLLVATATATYLVLSSRGEDELLSPPAVAALLVANLLPAMALMVLIARRVALRRAARAEIGGRGRLHVRLVALFSVVASVPTLLVVIFASLLLQSGINFWFSEQARSTITNARDASETYRQEQLADISAEIDFMGGDVVSRINEAGIDDPLMGDFLFNQTTRRKLLETALLSINSEGAIQMRAGVNLYDRPLESRFPVAELVAMQAGEVKTKFDGSDRIEGVVRLDPEAKLYVYGSREGTPLSRMVANAAAAADEYQAVLDRSRSYQLQFNAALFIVSLLIVAFAIWVALQLADRLVRPVGQLASAARKVTAGDLSARVPGARGRDEIGLLGKAFNRMTTRLEEQTGALVGANRQLENRRALIEAVLSGVTAGIISVDRERRVQLINPSAEALLRTGERDLVGQRLADIAPELDRHLDAEEGEDVVKITRDGAEHTLAVKRVKADGGHVLTFDDITEQLLDQRRAAWSDVARRIAHEIKNPLTPIQLAAERLQRRFAKEIDSDAATFEKLTGTIVRQVGDLRRIVDEFSSFARMPKPVFRPEAIADVARQALFLHEVAHSDISFRFDAPDPAPTLVCDRRLIGQALTNIVKNAVEAIQQRHDDRADEARNDEIAMAVREEGPNLFLTVSDTGIGLPADRRRITEPYMTTRARGTGLGLAIVKKIVEDHGGRIDFDDAPTGGTIVTLTFDRDVLSRITLGGARAVDDALQQVEPNGT
jgi:two-component system, NtrC family, nitrogen regulation sensor histidine kinase NtrY